MLMKRLLFCNNTLVDVTCFIFTGWFGIKIIAEVVVELVLAIGGPITSETQANAANMWVNFITYVILAAVFLAF